MGEEETVERLKKGERIGGRGGKKGEGEVVGGGNGKKRIEGEEKNEKDKKKKKEETKGNKEKEGEEKRGRRERLACSARPMQTWLFRRPISSLQ